MIRVLQTNKAYYPVVGGIETTFRNLCEGLSAERDVSVRALVCGSGSRWRDGNASLNGIPVTYAASLGTIFSMPISPSYVWQLAHAEAALIHVHSPFPLADIALLTSKRARYHHIVLTWHNDIVRQKRARALYLPLLRRFLDRVDRIAVGTPNNIPSSHILPEYAEKCDVIPYGIPLEWAQDMSAHAQEARALKERYGSPLVLFVGRLVYYKGIEYLIDAIAAVRDASLVIV